MSVRIVMMGPPGAGKGTQAVRLAQLLRVPTVSTGDIFRAHQQNGTALGQQVASFMAAGQLVPDTLTDALVADRLAQADVSDGFILDGYPRNVAQADALDGVLTAAGAELDVVVELTADTDAVVERLLRRATIEGRVDDTDAVIRERLAVYGAATEPLAELYVNRGILAQVDGLGEVDEVTDRLVAALAPYVGPLPE